MLIRNAIVYPFTGLAPQELQAAIDARPFNPLGAMDMEGIGFTPPVKGSPDNYRQVGDVLMICVRKDTKILPKSVVDAEAQARAEEIEEQRGFKVGPKQMRELKELVAAELLPKAFTRTVKVYALVDFAAGLVIINTASVGRAEETLGVLSRALRENDEWHLTAWHVNGIPGNSMTTWFRYGEEPAGFNLDDRALLVGEDSPAKVRISAQSVDDDDIRALAGGRACAELGMTYQSKVSFVLTRDLAIKRIDFLDIASIENDSQVEPLPEERVDAEILLSAKEVGGLVAALDGAMGGRRVMR